MCDELGDPLINDHHAVALGVVTYDELKRIYDMTAKINEVLTGLFDRMNITLVDFKIEFGRTSDGQIVFWRTRCRPTPAVCGTRLPTRSSTRTVSAATWGACARPTRRFSPVWRL